MIKKLRSSSGLTLLEVLIATILTGLVFAVAMSIYSSSIKFMNIQGAATDPTQSTVVALEEISKRISLCNAAQVQGGGKVLHLTCDYAVDSYTLNGGTGTPANLLDDNYWHYRLIGGELCMVSDNAPNTNPNPGIAPARTAIPSVNDAASSFAISRASGVGTVGTKVDIIIVTSAAPITEVRTSTILGAKATR